MEGLPRALAFEVFSEERLLGILDEDVCGAVWRVKNMLLSGWVGHRGARRGTGAPRRQSVARDERAHLRRIEFRDAGPRHRWRLAWVQAPSEER